MRSNISYEVKNKLLKIINTIFEKGEVPSDFRKILIKLFYKKDDESDCGSICLVSVGSKLLTMIVLFGLRDTFYGTWY